MFSKGEKVDTFGVVKVNYISLEMKEIKLCISEDY